MAWTARFKLAPDGTSIDFMRMRFAAFALSILLVLGSLGLIATKGIAFGVDFTGGTLIEIKVEKPPVLADLRASLNNLGVGSVGVQEFGDPLDLLIRLGQQEGGADAQQAAVATVRTALDQHFQGQTIDVRRIEFVGPQVGDELKRAGLIAMLLSIVGILIYVAARFEWQFGVAAVIALAHDAIVVLGFFALLQWEFDLSTMGAVLLVAGYSINDTIVVFDRIRENLRKYKKMPLIELFNLSTNQMLARSLMTSFTTLLALMALALFGGPVIAAFTWALIVGIVVGTFSSTYVAAGLLLYLNIRRGDATDDPQALAPGAGPA
jgi:preprotein translocase subunit SecF